MTENFFPDDEPQFAPTPSPPAGMVKNFFPEEGESDMMPVEKPRKPVVPGVLANNEDDPGWLSAAKGTGTAVIKGLANIPGSVKNYGNLVDYLMARGHAAITGRPLEEVQRDLQQRYATASQGASNLTGGVFKAPENVLPSGEDIAAPVLQKTGEYVPSTALGKLGMAGVETATSMIGPGGGARVVGAPIKATGLVPRIAETAITPAVKAAPMNMAAGAGAQAVTDTTGDPLPGLAAGVAIPAVASIPGKIVRPLAKPFTQSGRETGVGEQVLKASENPEALRQKLEQAGGNTQTIPGSQPTLAQWVGTDQGLHNAEMAARNDVGGKDTFAAVDKAQNTARLGTLEESAPTGVDTMRVPEAFQAHLDHIDQSTEEALNRLTEHAQAAAPKGTQEPEDVGNTLRPAIEATRGAEKGLYKQAYAAIDPEGKLNLVTTPARDAANQIANSMTEWTPPIENKDLKRILPKMQEMPDVMPLRHLGELDKDVTSAMFTERKANGESPDLARLTQLKGALKGAINDAVANQEKYETAAVARGEMRPEDTMEARLRQSWGVPDEQVQSGRQRSNAATVTAGAGAGSGRPAGEGAPLPTSGSGTNSQTGRGLPASTGDQGVSSQPSLTNEVSNVQGATGSTASPSQTPQDKAKALEARRQALAEAGIKTVPRGGELYTDTRGKGIQYHGTSEPNLKPTSEHYSTKNYYGQGFYTTDAAPDIAYGYSKKGSEATGGRYLYEVKENRPLKIADGEAPLQGDVGNLVSELGKRFDKTPYSTLDGVLADAIDEKPKNLRELYDNIREIGTSEGFSADTVQEVFDSVNEGLRQLGYNGLSHTGGQRTGNAPHKVVIYFNPEHDISVNRTSFNQGRVNETAPPQPTTAQPQELTPNLDAGAIDRVNAAKTAYTKYAQTYKSEPVAGALKTTGPATDYKMQASALPGKAFVSGDKGYETTGAFLKAAGDSPEAVSSLKDYARSLLAKRAVRPDGTLDPAGFAKWHDAHKGSLRAIEERSPGFIQEFRDAAQATDQMLMAQAARKEQLGEFQKSQAGAFLGKKTPTEVENTVGQILQKKDISSIEDLIKQASKDPAALDGLRKAATDWMARTFTNDSGERWMKSAAFRKFVNERYDALAKLYGNDQANMFRAIADDLTSADRPLASTAPKRGPGTAKDIAPFLKKTVEAAKHTSLFNAMAVGTMGGFEAHGMKGALYGAAGTGIAYAVGTLRAAGINTMKDMFRDALSSPERARYYVSKVPQEHALSAVTRSLRRELLLAKPIGADEPVGRASGGRVNTRDYPAKKASHIEKQMNRICKAYGGELNPMLHADDNTVARAMRIANRGRYADGGRIAPPEEGTVEGPTLNPFGVDPDQIRQITGLKPQGSLPGPLGLFGADVAKNAIEDTVNAATLPGDVYQGRVDLGSDEGLGRVVNMAGTLASTGLPMAEAGAAGIFGGKLTRDPAGFAKLGEGKDMLTAGANPRDTYLQTGAWKGPEGMMRYEIPDYNATLKTGAEAAIRTGKNFAGPLKDFVDHPEFFKAYPDLANTTVLFDPSKTSHHGYFAPGSNLIKLYGHEPSQVQSVLLHEMQHAVQKKEGFTPGWSQEGANNEATALLNKAEDLGMPRDQRLAFWNRFDPYDAYRRAAGEIEARAVQRRAELTPEQASIFNPDLDMTAQYPRPKWIVRTRQ